MSSVASRETRSKRARTRGTQEITISTRILRPKNSRKRSIKGKEKAVSSDEDEPEPEPLEANDVQQADEYLQNTASQSSSSASSPSEGKLSSTTSLELVETALARAEKELTSKNEVRRLPRASSPLTLNVFGRC